MASDLRGCIVGVDIGAGSGTKIGVFGLDHELLENGLVPAERYGDTAAHLAGELTGEIRRLLDRGTPRRGPLLALGIACPGLLASDGTLRPVANIPSLNNSNLKRLLGDRLAVPTACLNDADSGGLAEWSLQRREIFYWVFGGGWGGAWISARGTVRFPSIDWDGDDATLHYTNEPGYATPLPKETVRAVFERNGADFDRFVEVCIEERKPPDGRLTGPNGDPGSMRAEMVISGTGRWRVFHSLRAEHEDDLATLDPHEREALLRPATAGPPIDLLASRQADIAVMTDRIFGETLAEAAEIIFRQAVPDGCPRDIPILLGGKPSRALPFFGPPAHGAMRRKGIASELRISENERRGYNANLLGAAVLATDLVAAGSGETHA